MPKKVSKASSSKKSKKKTTSASKNKSSKGDARARTTKKTTTSVTKKTTTKKVAKKAATKKAGTKKKVTKKAASTKKVTKKTATKKTTTKKATVSKKKVSKAAATSKPASDKKTSTKKTPTKKTTKKSAPSSKSEPVKKKSKPAAGPTRFRNPFASSHDQGREAALRLASAAGLSGVSRASAEAKKQKAYKTITKTPFDAAQLEEFRAELIIKRRQLVGDVSSMETEALSGSEFSSHTPNHMADQGSDTYDQSLNLDLAASQRTLVNEIDAALVRIENGTYGVCELLGKPIKAERLRHAPWARFSIEAARMIENDPSILNRRPSDDDAE